MAKRKSGDRIAEQMNKWSEGLSKMFEEKRMIDEKLSPSISQLRYLEDYTRAMYNIAVQMRVLSDLAHSNVITFEQVQGGLNRQKVELKRSLEFIDQLIFPEEKEDERRLQDGLKGDI